ncbi:MAG: phosphoribosylformylglycinamidine synthase subunit PurL [Phycisphaerae bacterium]
MAEGFSDPHAEGVAGEIRELGIGGVEHVASAKLFFLYGDLGADDARRAAQELLADAVTQRFELFSAERPEDVGGSSPPAAVVEVHLKPGVMDPEAASAQQAIGDMGLSVSSVRTGRRYELSGHVSGTGRESIARKLLANVVIEDIYHQPHTPPEVHGEDYELNVAEVPIRDLDDAGLEKLSSDGDLFLNLTEMKAIQQYYRDLGREPRDVELETIAQTWSEHCVHKTFRSDVRVYDSQGNVVEEIRNLIKSTVFAATEKLNKPWCISVFKDNAGVIDFDGDTGMAVCFKVETHNHPSAIEPYGGASTGIGGVMRDPMGTGLGARPVANTDVFCFGPPDMPHDGLPTGVLHPRRVMRGVVAGVRDYGNRMGVPTINGAVYFDEKYLGNPLVFCGTVGMLPREMSFKHARGGDAVVMVGGRTGRDGIHGATFSSGELTHAHETEFCHAVQIGNAITEKKMLDTLLIARDEGLYSAITDCGAGGLSSAVGEMGDPLGAEVHLDRVPLKYRGLRYDEIWISEAQERMVLAVPSENVDRILEVFASEGVEATVLGHYGTEGRKLRLFYEDTVVGELDMEFLHEGCPRPAKTAVWDPRPKPSPAPPQRDNYNDVLLKIFAMPNVASKEWIIRQYDHEVQGGSAVKPLVGAEQDAPGDAAVVRPVLDSQKAVVVSCGMNPRLGELDPYNSALHAVDEAIRNNIAVGGNPDKLAILDNFCWGNCNKPDRMGSFVQAAKGCHDAAMAYGTPFISGKDSLNNEFVTDSGETIAIPPTLLISAMSVIDDAGRCVTADAKTAGDYLFIVGRTQPQLGGSHFLLAEGLETGNDVPPVDMPTAARVYRAIHSAMEAGCVAACHDLSEGGLAVAAAEMAFGGSLGVEIDLSAVPTDGDVSEAAKLFGESAGRLLVEVPPEKYDAFCRAVADCPFGELGRVTDSGQVLIRSERGDLIELDAADAKAAWQKTFDW